MQAAIARGSSAPPVWGSWQSMQRAVVHGDAARSRPSLELRVDERSGQRGDGPEWHCVQTALTMAGVVRSTAKPARAGAAAASVTPPGRKCIAAPVAAWARPPRWQLSQLMPTVTCA